MDEHVLLVEDDASIREVATLGLEQSGLRVTAVGDGREGLDRFRQGGVDLVVLDVMLPSLDGFEVLREIRHDSQAPIVMLTARSELHDVVVGLELGADDYVTKPFELPELVARVKAVLRRAAPAGDGAHDQRRRARDRPGRVHGQEARRGAAADGDRVPAAARARAAAEAGLHARAAARAGLELRLPRRLAPRRRGRAAAAGEGRGRSEAAGADQDRARGRLPLRRRLVTLRRRLTLVLALAVGLSGIALAAGSYFLVRHNLLSDSVDSSIVQTRRNLAVAPAYRDTGKLVDAYKSRGDFLTVATHGGQTFLSSASVSLRSVPAGLRAVVGRGELGYERTTVAGDRFLVTGAPARQREEALLLLPRERPAARALGAAQRAARRGRDPRAAGGAGGRRARAQHAAAGRAGEHGRAVAGRGPARDAAAGRGPGRVRRLGAVVQRDGGGAGGEDRRAAGRAGAGAALHRRRRARAAHAADRADGRGLAAGRPPRPRCRPRRAGRPSC